MFRRNVSPQSLGSNTPSKIPKCKQMTSWPCQESNLGSSVHPMNVCMGHGSGITQIKRDVRRNWGVILTLQPLWFLQSLPMNILAIIGLYTGNETFVPLTYSWVQRPFLIGARRLWRSSKRPWKSMTWCRVSKGNFCVPKYIFSLFKYLTEIRQFSNRWKLSLPHRLAHPIALYERHNGIMTEKCKFWRFYPAARYRCSSWRKITKIFRPILGTETWMLSRALIAASGIQVIVD
jgi:hypothetical protein